MISVLLTETALQHFSKCIVNFAMYSKFGKDLYDFRSGGRSLVDSVRFIVTCTNTLVRVRQTGSQICATSRQS